MEKAKQWHFYLAPSLRAKCEAVFEEQGVTVSEGFARMAKLLVESSDEVRLLLLKQARGDAAVVLAENVLKKARAADQEVDEETGEPIPDVGKVSLQKGSAGAGPAKRGKQPSR